MCAALNPLSASLLSVFANNAQSGAGGAGGANAPNIAIHSAGGQFVFLNFNSNSLSNSMHSNASSISSSSASSIANQHIERADWINRIENSSIDRAHMNKLIMNYLVTEGFKDAADKFQTETGVEHENESESLNERIRIREAIENGKISEAIELINNLYPELIDNNRIIAFHLQQQEFIELVKDKKLEDALSYAQNHLCEYGENNEQIKEELERSMALLAFDDPFQSPFSDLLQPLQRHKLSSEINSAILDYENLESNAKLNILIKMLLWSQDLLDKRSVVYPKMIDIANARIEEPIFNPANN